MNCINKIKKKSLEKEKVKVKSAHQKSQYIFKKVISGIQTCRQVTHCCLTSLLYSVLQKFLIKLPGGVFGPEIERKFLAVLEIPQRVEQYEEFNK